MGNKMTSEEADKIFNRNANYFMIQWDLRKFKTTHPKLYMSIIKSIMQVGSPNLDDIEKQLLDRFGFIDDEDGEHGIDADNQLKIFSFMDWLKAPNEPANKSHKDWTEANRVRKSDKKSQFTASGLKSKFVASELNTENYNIIKFTPSELSNTNYGITSKASLKVGDNQVDSDPEIIKVVDELPSEKQIKAHALAFVVRNNLNVFPDTSRLDEDSATYFNYRKCFTSGAEFLLSVALPIIEKIKQEKEILRQSVGRSGEDYLLEIERKNNHLESLKQDVEKSKKDQEIIRDTFSKKLIQCEAERKQAVKDYNLINDKYQRQSETIEKLRKELNEK